MFADFGILLIQGGYVHSHIGQQMFKLGELFLVVLAFKFSQRIGGQRKRDLCLGFTKSGWEVGSIKLHNKLLGWLRVIIAQTHRAEQVAIMWVAG